MLDQSGSSYHDGKKQAPRQPFKGNPVMIIVQFQKDGGEDSQEEEIETGLPEVARA
jgi:hypothetical protein